MAAVWLYMGLMRACSDIYCAYGWLIIIESSHWLHLKGRTSWGGVKVWESGRVLGLCRSAEARVSPSVSVCVQGPICCITLAIKSHTKNKRTVLSCSSLGLTPRLESSQSTFATCTDMTPDSPTTAFLLPPYLLALSINACTLPANPTPNLPAISYALATVSHCLPSYKIMGCDDARTRARCSRLWMAGLRGRTQLLGGRLWFRAACRDRIAFSRRVRLGMELSCVREWVSSCRVPSHLALHCLTRSYMRPADWPPLPVSSAISASRQPTISALHSCSLSPCLSTPCLPLPSASPSM